MHHEARHRPQQSTLRGREKHGRGKERESGERVGGLRAEPHPLPNRDKDAIAEIQFQNKYFLSTGRCG